MHKAISKCRICGGETFDSVLNLGQQALTGVFPKAEDQHVPVGPLELVKCSEASGGCGLVQLRHSYDPSEMYGDNYGYRSGLNQSMVQHLNRRVQHALSIVSPESGDVILDIGSKKNPKKKNIRQSIVVKLNFPNNDPLLQQSLDNSQAQPQTGTTQ